LPRFSGAQKKLLSTRQGQAQGFLRLIRDIHGQLIVTGNLPRRGEESHAVLPELGVNGEITSFRGCASDDVAAIGIVFRPQVEGRGQDSRHGHRSHVHYPLSPDIPCGVLGIPLVLRLANRADDRKVHTS
jgi:hypothetical protein